MVLIEIFGAGCEDCARLESKVKSAVERLGLKADIYIIEEFEILLKRDIISTPGLAIDRKIVSMGRVPTVDEIIELLKR